MEVASVACSCRRRREGPEAPSTDAGAVTARARAMTKVMARDARSLQETGNPRRDMLAGFGLAGWSQAVPTHLCTSESLDLHTCVLGRQSCNFRITKAQRKQHLESPGKMAAPPPQPSPLRERYMKLMQRFTSIQVWNLICRFGTLRMSGLFETRARSVVWVCEPDVGLLTCFLFLSCWALCTSCVQCNPSLGFSPTKSFHPSAPTASVPWRNACRTCCRGPIVDLFLRSCSPVPFLFCRRSSSAVPHECGLCTRPAPWLRVSFAGCVHVGPLQLHLF